MVFGCREKRHPGLVEVVGEHPAQIIVGDLADKAGPTTEARQTVAGVGHRAAARHHIGGNL